MKNILMDSGVLMHLGPMTEPEFKELVLKTLEASSSQSRLNDIHYQTAVQSLGRVPRYFEFLTQEVKYLPLDASREAYFNALKRVIDRVFSYSYPNPDRLKYIFKTAHKPVLPALTNLALSNEEV